MNDDIDKVRSAFPEQPGPSPETTAAARRQVQALIREEQTIRRRDRWYAAAKSGRIGVALTATAATVALAALATPLLLSPGPGFGDGDAGPAPSTVTPTTPRLTTVSQTLVQLAIKQETDEKVSGKYFRVRNLQLRGMLQVGSPKYRIEERTITESWMPMRQGAESWFGWVDLGARPATRADAAKWRAQGSPTQWPMTETKPVKLAPGEPVVNKMTFDQVPPGYFLSGVKPVTAQQIQALPTDPEKLRAVLAADPQPGMTAGQLDYQVFTAAGRLLFEMPSPPKLRGAALRVLSMLPGVRLTENVKDPLGRVGVRFSMDWSKTGRPGGEATLMFDGRTNYVVDPATGRLLCSEYDGLKRGASVVLESGWTDEKPTPPSPAVR
ncbi:CU044_5270 family protein [Kribbella sp. CA-293567]|uniref:CU044_5270 family protein n=1 Tax=Kribbella sp. CA-293567 TaxID=3002436 RepID=UPI0022DD843C|nr:CU044_5270 family protein [Kribbella sp. CA-293567]WBQ07426.1 CU044_5270 family protein [Kribbella sp. CA-293567]